MSSYYDAFEMSPVPTPSLEKMGIVPPDSLDAENDVVVMDGGRER